MTVRPQLLPLLALVLACTKPGTQGSMHASSEPSAYGPVVDDAIRRVRAATSVYRTLDSAVVAGYPREVKNCIGGHHEGTMGYHHVNRANVDTKLEVERPEILIYERAQDGSYRLNGVEYIVPYRLWSRDSVPPMIMGKQLLRSDSLNLWYLHAWIWRPNPSGLFADWHPDVRCPML